MGGNLVEQKTIAEMLAELTSKPHVIELRAGPAPTAKPLSDAEIDRILEGLLRKQRGGSLGLNE